MTDQPGDGSGHADQPPYPDEPDGYPGEQPPHLDTSGQPPYVAPPPQYPPPPHSEPQFSEPQFSEQQYSEQPYPEQPGGYPSQSVPSYPAPPGYAGQDPNTGFGTPMPYSSYPGGADPYARPGRSGWAIAAFVTGLVPLIGILAAIPLGIVALVKISHTRAKGRWMAITGMVLSVLWWAGVVAIGLYAVNHQAHRNQAGQIDKAGSISFGNVRVGDCLTINGIVGGGPIGSLKGVPCADPHNAQAYYIVPFAAGDYPGETVLRQQAKLGCEPRFTPYAAAGREPYYLFPTEGLWRASNGHRAICFVISASHLPTRGSVVSTGH